MGFGVTVDFNANLVKLNSQVDKAFQRFDDFQKKAESMSAGINKSLGALGVGLSAGALVSFVKSGIDAADALNDMSDRTGIAVEKLAGFKLAAKLADTDLESFAKSVNKLSINIAKNGEDFAKLGVTAKDPAEAFLQFAAAFQAIDDPQKRAAVGAAAMGKAYAEMAPLLLQNVEVTRQQMQQGQEMSGITTQQAKVAADLNDKLDALGVRLTSLSAVLVGPLLPAMAEFTASLEYAAKQSDALGNGGFIDRLLGGSDYQMSINKLTKLNEDIASTQKAMDNLQDAGVGKTLVYDLVFDQRASTLQNELNVLKQQRDIALKDFQDQNAKLHANKSALPALPKITEIPASFLGGDNGKADKAAAEADRLAKAEASRADSIQKLIDKLQLEIDVSRLSDDEKARALELSSALEKAKGGEIDVITRLVNKKYDDIEASKRQQAQWSQLVEDRNKLFDLNKEVDFFSRSSNIDSESFNQLIIKIREVGKETDATDAEMKALLDKAGAAFNENYSEKLDAMSEYAISAARNMQSAFADFLFDPFAKGADGMLAAFGNTIRRMVAEAASAQIMEGLLGKQSKDGGFSLGGLAGAAWSGISSFFADGGIMTSAGPIPLNRYAGGGIANSPQLALFGEGRMNEAYVPLPDGRSIPVTMSGQNSGTVNNVTIQVQGGNSPEDTGRRVGEAFIRTIARDEISNATRAGNKLNPTTRF